MDELRVAKWDRRAAAWLELADIAADAHVADVCRQMAAQSQMMSRFWRKVR